MVSCPMYRGRGECGFHSREHYEVTDEHVEAYCIGKEEGAFKGCETFQAFTQAERERQKERDSPSPQTLQSDSSKHPIARYELGEYI